jgi:hypothetical protein
MKLHRCRAAVATVIVTALIGWAGAGVAAADSKWTGDTSDDSKWLVVPQDSKWL